MRLLLITILFTSLVPAALALNINTNAPIMKEAEVGENEGMTFYSIQEDKVQYYITKPNHPAYPYMIKKNVQIFQGKKLLDLFKINGMIIT